MEPITKICPDGSGGIITVYASHCDGLNPKIKLQRLDNANKLVLNLELPDIDFLVRFKEVIDSFVEAHRQENAKKSSRKITT